MIKKIEICIAFYNIFVTDSKNSKNEQRQRSNK